MSMIYVLLPASMLLAFVGVCGFVWAARNRQFDAIEVSAARLLFERDENKVPHSQPGPNPVGAVTNVADPSEQSPF
jgi:cbb3-type cytochrome oxidase maturation protein